MERRDLASTGLVSSRLVLGTMTFGSQVDQTGANEMVGLALEAGIDHFDTANAYNHGASEKMLKTALGRRRDEVSIATKVFNKMGDGPDEAGLGKAAVRRAIDESLARLGTDHVELYYLHQPDARVPIEETLAVMSELVAAGKVRHLGVSNYAAWQVASMIERARSNRWPEPRIGQQLYNPISRGLEEEYAGFAADYGVATLVYNPLAGGLLTGKHRNLGQVAPGRFSDNETYRARYWSQPQLTAARRLGEVAASSGLSPVGLCLRWLLARPLVDGVILGASSPEQLRANLVAAEGPPLAPELVAVMDEVWAGVRGAFPRYNR